MSNNLEQCRNLYEKGISDAKKLGYSKGLAESYKHASLVYSLLADYKKAIKYNQYALDYYEKKRSYNEVTTLYADIGFRIRYVDHDEALHYFRKAMEIGKKFRCNKELISVFNNYSTLLVDAHLDSSIYYAQKSLEYCHKYNAPVGIPFAHNNLSVYYSKKKNFTKAFKHLTASDLIRMTSKDTAGIADNIAYRADIYFEMPQVDSAIYYYEKSLILAKKVNYNSLERFCLNRLSELYQRKGDYKKAFENFKQFKNIEDSVLNKSIKNEIAQLEVKYGTEKTKRSLAEKEAKLEQRKTWLILSFSVAALLIVFLFFVYRYQRAKRNTIQKELELKQELEKTKLEKEFADEKIRIARELHDNIGSHLTFMISSLDNLTYLENQEKKLEKIADLSTFGRQTMKDLRDTIWAMNHDGGSFDQLIARISELRNVLPENIHVSIRSTVSNNQLLNGLQLLNCFRIVQEFIQNTIKYAEATEIEITFSVIPQGVKLHISDNGKGFDFQQIHFGNGILNMKRRTEDINGVFDIQSDSTGTNVTCTFQL